MVGGDVVACGGGLVMLGCVLLHPQVLWWHFLTSSYLCGVFTFVCVCVCGF